MSEYFLECHLSPHLWSRAQVRCLCLSIHTFIGQNVPLVQSFVVLFFACSIMPELLINIESLVSAPTSKMITSCLVWARPMRGFIILSMTIISSALIAFRNELNDLILRLGLDEHICTHLHITVFIVFVAMSC